MLKLTATSFVFLGGFAIMVLEIIGARYLAKDFGGSFYVWISQIGVILIALVGGALFWWWTRSLSEKLPPAKPRPTPSKRAGNR